MILFLHFPAGWFGKFHPLSASTPILESATEAEKRFFENSFCPFLFETPPPPLGSDVAFWPRLSLLPLCQTAVVSGDSSPSLIQCLIHLQLAAGMAFMTKDCNIARTFLPHPLLISCFSSRSKIAFTQKSLNTPHSSPATCIRRAAKCGRGKFFLHNADREAQPRRPLSDEMLGRMTTDHAPLFLTDFSTNDRLCFQTKNVLNREYYIIFALNRFYSSL